MFVTGRSVSAARTERCGSPDKVVAVEPERYLRERAEHAASQVPISISVAHGGADRLPGEEASFDAGVLALERFPFSPAPFLVPDPHILGIARRA